MRVQTSEAIIKEIKKVLYSYHTCSISKKEVISSVESILNKLLGDVDDLEKRKLEIEKKITDLIQKEKDESMTYGPAALARLKNVVKSKSNAFVINGEMHHHDCFNGELFHIDIFSFYENFDQYIEEWIVPTKEDMMISIWAI
ncbi:hypothetical protein QO179_23810 [Bacillus stercoris]|nr:hypothetical protein [Bacillus stercoris]